MEPDEKTEQIEGPIFLRDYEGSRYGLFFPDANNIEIKRGAKISMFDLNEPADSPRREGNVLRPYQTVAVQK